MTFSKFVKFKMWTYLLILFIHIIFFASEIIFLPTLTNRSVVNVFDQIMKFYLEISYFIITKEKCRIFDFRNFELSDFCFQRSKKPNADSFCWEFLTDFNSIQKGEGNIAGSFLPQHSGDQGSADSALVCSISLFQVNFRAHLVIFVNSNS